MTDINEKCGRHPISIKTPVAPEIEDMPSMASLSEHYSQTIRSVQKQRVSTFHTQEGE